MSDVPVVPVVSTSAPEPPASADVRVDAGQGPPVEPAQPRAPRGAPKWETDARERVRTMVRRFTKPLADLVARDANEGDTRLWVTDFLCEALGFDKYEDLTTEYQVKVDFADYGIRLDKQLVAFIEVKRCTQKLNERHLRQVQMYSVNEGVEWMILTNGQTWQVYHLSGGLPVVIDRVLEVNLLAEGTVAHKADGMFYLTKEAMRRRTIEELWREKAATSPRSLASVVLSEPVLDAMRKELRRRTGFNGDADTIGLIVRDEVIRPELLAKDKNLG